jgi:hypothetical protein
VVQNENKKIKGTSYVLNAGKRSLRAGKRKKRVIWFNFLRHSMFRKKTKGRGIKAKA